MPGVIGSTQDSTSVILAETAAGLTGTLSRTNYAVVLLILVVIGATNFLIRVGVGLVATKAQAIAYALEENPK